MYPSKVKLRAGLHFDNASERRGRVPITVKGYPTAGGPLTVPPRRGLGDAAVQRTYTYHRSSRSTVPRCCARKSSKTRTVRALYPVPRRRWTTGGVSANAVGRGHWAAVAHTVPLSLAHAEWQSLPMRTSPWLSAKSNDGP